MTSLLELGVKHCDCKVDYTPDGVTGKSIECYYHGQGVWQCPECAEIRDYSDVVYEIFIIYSKVPEEDSMELIYNAKIETEDERLLKPVDPKIYPKYTNLKSMEDDIYDIINDTDRETNIGKYKLEIYWIWDQVHTDGGMEWVLDMFVISEEKITVGGT